MSHSQEFCVFEGETLKTSSTSPARARAPLHPPTESYAWSYAIPAPVLTGPKRDCKMQNGVRTKAPTKSTQHKETCHDSSRIQLSTN